MRSTREILESLLSGQISLEEAEEALKDLSLTRVGNMALLDTIREERTGVPEIVFGESKTNEEILRIGHKMLEMKGYALLSRVRSSTVEFLLKNLKGFKCEAVGTGEYQTLLVTSKDWEPDKILTRIAIITGGTSDFAYAEEARLVAHMMGVEALTFYDVGVAGIHRLIEPIKEIRREQVAAIVVLAGMEGALPTLVASLIDIPVIGVPVPTGYGFGGKGKTALASMLQSCAPGLSVVNIGNGTGAGAMAALIAKRCERTGSR